MYMYREVRTELSVANRSKTTRGLDGLAVVEAVDADTSTCRDDTMIG